ncbi:MAG: hypothetical protein OHK0022_22430 [Roseiflexaceae bacterium]
MRTTNLSHRSPLPGTTFLVYQKNRRFIEGRSRRSYNPYVGTLVGLGVVGLLGLLLLLNMIFGVVDTPFVGPPGWLIFTVLILVGIVPSFLVWRERRLLAREGWLISGEVVSASLGRATDDSVELSLSYRFTALDGTVVSGNTRANFNPQFAVAPTQAPRPGTALAILYISPDTYEIL